MKFYHFLGLYQPFCQVDLQVPSSFGCYNNGIFFFFLTYFCNCWGWHSSLELHGLFATSPSLSVSHLLSFRCLCSGFCCSAIKSLLKMAHNHMKGCSACLIAVMQITLRQHFLLKRWAKFQKFDHMHCWQVCGGNTFLLAGGNVKQYIIFVG